MIGKTLARGEGGHAADNDFRDNGEEDCQDERGQRDTARCAQSLLLGMTLSSSSGNPVRHPHGAFGVADATPPGWRTLSAVC